MAFKVVGLPIRVARIMTTDKEDITTTAAIEPVTACPSTNGILIRTTNDGVGSSGPINDHFPAQECGGTEVQGIILPSPKDPDQACRKITVFKRGLGVIHNFLNP